MDSGKVKESLTDHKKPAGKQALSDMPAPAATSHAEATPGLAGEADPVDEPGIRPNGLCWGKDKHGKKQLSHRQSRTTPYS
jgi:hypothetical protein